MANGIFILDSFSIAKTKTGKDYANMKLKNKKGSYDAKMWDCIPAIAMTLHIGNVYDVEYTETTYNGNIQLTVSACSHNQVTPVESLMCGANFPIDTMWDKVVETIDSFEDPFIRYIAEEVVVNLWDDCVKIAPAAKSVHNAWVGGLLEHMYSMIKLAEPIIKHYQVLAPNLSRDKILFGVIMHDIGKCTEYTQQGGSFVVTKSGILVPHLVQACTLIATVAMQYKLAIPAQQNVVEQLKEQVRTTEELIHIVASHHGKLEWGSPCVPATLEAVILHQLDMIDSQFMHAWGMMKEKDDTNPALTKRSFIQGTHYIRQEVKND